MFENSEIKKVEKDINENILELNDDELRIRWDQRQNYSEYTNKLLEKEVFKRGLDLYRDSGVHDYTHINNKVLADHEFYSYEKFLGLYERIIYIITCFVLFAGFYGIYLLWKDSEAIFANIKDQFEKIIFLIPFVVIYLFSIIIYIGFKLLVINRKIYNLNLYRLKKEKF